jgi:hypothetical protein
MEGGFATDETEASGRSKKTTVERLEDEIEQYSFENAAYETIS